MYYCSNYDWFPKYLSCENAASVAERTKAPNFRRTIFTGCQFKPCLVDCSYLENFQLVAYQQTDKWQGPTFQLLQICLKCTSLIICLCSNISTTPITAMRCRQYLSLSVVQLKSKHQKHHCTKVRFCSLFSGGFITAIVVIHRKGNWQNAPLCTVQTNTAIYYGHPDLPSEEKSKFESKENKTARKCS